MNENKLIRRAGILLAAGLLLYSCATAKFPQYHPQIDSAQVRGVANALCVNEKKPRETHTRYLLVYSGKPASTIVFDSFKDINIDKKMHEKIKAYGYTNRLETFDSHENGGIKFLIATKEGGKVISVRSRPDEFFDFEEYIWKSGEIIQRSWESEMPTSRMLPEIDFIINNPEDRSDEVCFSEGRKTREGVCTILTLGKPKFYVETFPVYDSAYVCIRFDGNLSVRSRHPIEGMEFLPPFPELQGKEK